jgi:hypothetical protein
MTFSKAMPGGFNPANTGFLRELPAGRRLSVSDLRPD